MSYWYGKPFPEVYDEISSMHKLANFSGIYNVCMNHSKTILALKYWQKIAEIVSELADKGYIVTINKVGKPFIVTISMWNVITDEVLRFMPRKPENEKKFI